MDKLTAAAIRNAKPTDKVQRLFDGAGLYLEVSTTGGRYWRWKYRHAGKEKRLAIGVDPVVSLAEPRALREKARTMLRQRRDPSAERRSEKRDSRLAADNAFEALAREWLV